MSLMLFQLCHKQYYIRFKTFGDCVRFTVIASQQHIQITVMFASKQYKFGLKITASQDILLFRNYKIEYTM